jgi:Sec-independent protein translocase protein TatA
MEILNIGFPELILILIVMLIVLGPDQTIQQMKNLARFVRKLVRSPLWADIMNTSREIKDLPTKMLRETGLEEDVAEMNRWINPSIAAQESKQGAQRDQSGEIIEKDRPAEAKDTPPDES